MGGNSGVDYDIVLSRIVIDAEATDNNESSTAVDFSGEIPQDRTKIRKRES